MIVDKKIQELNIPGIRKLKGGEIVSENIISKLKKDDKYKEFLKYFISDSEQKKDEEESKKEESQKKAEELKNKGKNEFINRA